MLAVVRGVPTVGLEGDDLERFLRRDGVSKVSARDLGWACARSAGITGAAVTPFLLAAVERETGGASLAANLALLESNAALAAQIAVALREGG